MPDFAGSKVYASLGVTCHLHFWQNDQGLLRATAVTEVERTSNKSQRTKLILEKKISPLLLKGLELETIRSRARHSTNAIPAPPADDAVPSNQV